MPAVLTIVLAACGSDVAPKTGGPVSVNNQVTNNASTSDAGMTDPDGGMTGVPDATMSSEDAPEFLELGATPNRVTNAAPANISAIVTDPQGAGDIVAVRLIEQSTGQPLGNFQADGGGAYSFSLDWNTLNAIVDLTFDVDLGLIVTAEAIDTAGERSTRSLELRVACDDNGPACNGTCGEQLCDGECATGEDFFFDPNNCGACGVVCPDGLCEGGECVGALDVDAPCQTLSDCEDGASFCSDEATTGLSGGWCVYECFGSEDCGPQGECVRVAVDPDGNQTVQLCVAPCSANGDCRQGWLCQPGPNIEGENLSFCTPPEPM
jgi:hypothetical protein